MLLSDITGDDILIAAKRIDEEGIPEDHISNQYYIVVKGREYPFKYLTYCAWEAASKSLTENIKRQFKSNENYRAYIKGLGFELRFYKEGINFFTPEELDFYAKIAGEDYRVSDRNQRFYKQKLAGLIAKLNYWAARVKPYNYGIKRDRQWLNQKTQVKSYIWPRVYFGEDKDVFFNVEVNAKDRFIGYKLDGYYETTKRLSPDQLAILDQFKVENNTGFIKIPFSEIRDHNWESLIDKTMSYINNFHPQLVELKNLLAKETRGSRIIWNTNGWTAPSGWDGKSKFTGFEAKYGFGFDEWLLDSSREHGGYIYGFLPSVYVDYSANVGRLMDVYLFTRNGNEGRYYWVGKLERVEVLTPAQAKDILAVYRSNGCYDEMEEEIHLLGLDVSAIEKWVGTQAENLINVRFPKESISGLLPELVPVTGTGVITTEHYKLLRSSVADIHKAFSADTASRFSFDTGNAEPDEVVKGTRKRTKGESELEYRHADLQNKLLVFLQARYGKDTVRKECQAFGGCKIDLVRETAEGYIFYEVKVYNNLRLSIRESIGQLLDYCFFPARKEAVELVLVSDVAPSWDCICYLQTLKNMLPIDFHYLQFDAHTSSIVETF